MAVAGLGEPLGDQSGRGDFGRGQGLTAPAQQAEHDVVQFLVALAINQPAEVFVDLGHGRFDLGAAIGFAIAFSDDPQDDRRPAGVDADAGNSPATDKIGQERLDLAFTRAEALDVPPQNDAAARPHAAKRRKQRTVPHLPHFRGNARQGEEPATAAVRPRNVDLDAGRGAVGVWNDAAPFGEEGLTLVAFGHFPLPPGEEPPDVFKGLWHHDQRAVRRCGECLAGEIVGRRPQPAGRNDDVGPLDRAAKDVDAGLQFVADGRMIEHADTRLAESLAEPLRIGVEELSAGDFVANGEDLGVHQQVNGRRG